MARKFVVVKEDSTGDLSMRLSNCVKCHFELVTKGYTCIGGGHFHRDGNNIYLYGYSIDYSCASLEDCQIALENTLSSWSDFTYFYSEVKECPVGLSEILFNPLTRIN